MGRHQFWRHTVAICLLCVLVHVTYSICRLDNKHFWSKPVEKEKSHTSFECRSKDAVLNLIGDAQLPPPEYPWTVPGVGNASDSESKVYPGLLTNVETFIRGEQLGEGKSDDWCLLVIRNGQILGRMPETTVHPDRFNGFVDLAQSALNLGKTLASWTSNSCDDSLLPPRWRELVNIENVSIPILFSIGDFTSGPCRDATQRNYISSFLPVFGWSRESDGLPINFGKEKCRAMEFAVPGYAFWNPLRSASIVTSSDWEGSPNNTTVLEHTPTLLWDLGKNGMDTKYPWSDKIPKAVWRGTTTGIARSWREIPRTQLVNHSRSFPGLLDAGFTRADYLFAKNDKEMRRKSFMKNIINFSDFMKYKAIVDIDGYSWSSRFGNLLCMNSVVIKIAPKWSDYWHDELQPWVHYVPVKGDMSDLIDQIRFVMDPANDDKMRGIVNAANSWCRKKMTLTQFSIDMLWILSSYLDVLDDATAVADIAAETSPPSTSASSPLLRWLYKWDGVAESLDLAPVAPNALFSMSSSIGNDGLSS